jgi:hypothetical protein
MAQAVSQLLLNTLLLGDSYNSRFKMLFQPALKRMSENLPYRLKDFRGNWRQIQPTKLATLVKEQMNIDYLKKEVERIKADQSYFYKISIKAIGELHQQLGMEYEKCRENPECQANLAVHLKDCDNGCTRSDASYQCLYEDKNGRCRHYYIMKSLEERLEGYEYTENEYDWEYEERLFEYKRAVRIQQLGSEDAYYNEMRNKF